MTRTTRKAPTPPKRGVGRPSLGHEGHTGRADRCEACRIRLWREGRGLTQAQAAAMIPYGRTQTDPRTWQRWERGELRVPPLVLRFIEMVEQARRG